MAEEVIKNEDLIQKDVFADFRKSSEEALVSLKTIHQAFNDFLNLTKEQSKEFAKPTSMPKEWDAQAEVIKEATRVANANIAVMAKIKVTQEGLTDTLNENRIAYAELNKEKKTEAQLNKAAEGSIEQLRAKLAQATREYDKLSAAIRNSNDGFAKLEKIKAYSKELNEVEQASGRFQRNVGNYASGFDGLSRSINQLTREAPSAAVSMNTFFLAISNNIPALIDEIDALKKKNVELAASGEPTVSVLGRVAGAFLSWQTLISVGITLLTLYGGKLFDYITGTDDATKSTLDWNKELEKADKNIEQLTRKMEDAALRIRVASGGISKEAAEAFKINRETTDAQAQAYKTFLENIKAAKEQLAKDRGEETTSEDLISAQIRGRSLPGFTPGKGFTDYFRRLDEAAAKLRESNAQSTATQQKQLEASKVEIDKANSKEKKQKEEHYKTMEQINKEDFDREIQLLKQSEDEKLNELNKNYIAGTVSEKQYQKAVYKIEQDGLAARMNLERVYRQDVSDATDKYRKNELDAFKQDQKDQQAILDAAYKYNEDLSKLASQKELNKKKAEADDRIAREKQLYDSLGKIIDQYYSKEETKLDRSIAAAQHRQQTLELLAQQGVDNAAASLAQEQKNEAEAEAKKEELAKKKQRAEFALTVLKMETANLEANPDNPGKATIQTAAQVAALVAIIEGLPSFFEGTEDTGDGGTLDANGGHLAILHKKERVMDAENNLKTGYMPNDELANVAAMYNAGMLVPVGSQPQFISTRSDQVVNELREVKQAIKSLDMPNTEFYYDTLSESFVKRVETKTKITRDHFKPSNSLW